jgi:DNA-binding NarL/FixJ family response regulator
MLVNVDSTVANILVLSNDELLLTGVARLLGSTYRVIVYPVPQNGEKEMINKIQSTACEAVIVDFSLITSGQLHMTTLLECKNTLRVLLMSIHSNEFVIYEKHKVLLERSEDLLSLFDRSSVAIDDIQSLSLISS